MTVAVGALAAAFGGASTLALADTMTLAPSIDNTLYDSPTGSLSNGAGQYFFAGTTARGDKRRGVLAFDITGSVPAGSTITSASLTLNMSKTVTGAVPVSLYLLDADWGEGSSAASGEEGGGAPPAAGDATWVHRFFPSVFWVNPGGDFVSIPRATTSVNQDGPYTWSSPDMVADVQQWLDSPSRNHGWIIVGGEQVAATAKRFDSRQFPIPSLRPSLRLTFTPAGPASGDVTSLLVQKSGPTNLALSWGASCLPGDGDYEVYEGILGSYTTHTPRLCTTAGATAATIAPPAEGAYYLVVPRNGSREGSYGKDSSSLQRPLGPLSCLPQSLGACP